MYQFCDFVADVHGKKENAVFKKISRRGLQTMAYVTHLNAMIVLLNSQVNKLSIIENVVDLVFFKMISTGLLKSNTMQR